MKKFFSENTFLLEQQYILDTDKTIETSKFQNFLKRNKFRNYWIII